MLCLDDITVLFFLISIIFVFYISTLYIVTKTKNNIVSVFPKVYKKKENYELIEKIKKKSTNDLVDSDEIKTPDNQNEMHDNSISPKPFENSDVLDVYHNDRLGKNNYAALNGGSSRGTNADSNAVPKFNIFSDYRMNRYINNELDDPLTPPFRLPYYYSNYPHIKPEGNPRLGRFRKLGTLIAQSLQANDRFKILILIGRQKHYSRNYEYYAISSDTNDRIKFFIDKNGKEIYHNDTVLIKELNIIYEFKEDPSFSFDYDNVI